MRHQQPVLQSSGHRDAILSRIVCSSSSAHRHPCSGLTAIYDTEISSYSRHGKALVHFHGLYTTHPNTTVFARIAQPTAKPYGLSFRCMATSLAAAQDSIGSTQVPGPAKDDPHIIKYI